MAKLVGTYKFVVSSVDVGKNANGNDVLKLGLTFTDELLNDQDVPLTAQPKVPYNMSLKRSAGRTGKSAAQVTVETLAKVFGFKKHVSDLHELMFSQGYAVCPDHDQGNFTRVERIYNLNAKSSTGNKAALEEFSSDVQDELNRLFDAL